MPLRRRSAQDAPPATLTPEQDASTDADDGRKGRPTPTRKEQEAANRRPLVVTDRRAAAREARAKARSDRQTQLEAMRSNDQSKLPARDQGPVRAYIRDFVDARWNVGELFLFGAFALLILSMVFAGQDGSAMLLSMIFMGAIYVIVILAVIDGFILWRHLKARIIAKFGEDKLEKGLLMYAVTRAFQIRRARLPRPTSKKHGNYPD